jgi:hypothetical protein
MMWGGRRGGFGRFGGFGGYGGGGPWMMRRRMMGPRMGMGPGWGGYGRGMGCGGCFPFLMLSTLLILGLLTGSIRRARASRFGHSLA